MAALRHIAAIRSRLLQSTVLVPIVALTPDGTPAIYAANIFDVKEPAFPCVTIYQSEANLAVWAPRMLDPGRVLIECYSKLNNRQSSEMEEDIEAMLHKQEVLTSTVNAQFGEIRKLQWAMSQFDTDTRAWRVTSQYLIRVSVS